jgi:hypothetical protein
MLRRFGRSNWSIGSSAQNVIMKMKLPVDILERVTYDLIVIGSGPAGEKGVSSKARERPWRLTLPETGEVERGLLDLHRHLLQLSNAVRPTNTRPATRWA